jgi:4-amino-4-deoxychorismate lyase
MNSQLFIETMRVVDGQIANLSGHIGRMQRTVQEVFKCEPELQQLRNLAIPAEAKKCRIVYGTAIESIEFVDYKPRHISTLKLVEATPELDYHLKYADRSALNKLAELRGDCDEILIVKDGQVTDTSFSNVVFTDGQRFVTPSSYLLPGTMRAALLQSGAVTEAPIRPGDLQQFSHVTLINAMLPLHAFPLIPISNIH